MKEIPDNVIDLILCDLPYGTTQNKWDNILPLDKLWTEYWRVCKSNAAIILTTVQPFTSILIVSQLKYFKYEWIWDKKRPTGQLNVKKQPLRQHETILVFYKEQCLYNPSMHANRLKRKFKGNIEKGKKESDNYGDQYTYNSNISMEDLSYPRSIIEQTTVIGNSKEKIHPTQKPVALFEYLIKTYTNENDLVLDNCAGSGTTAIAAINTKRKWICIEKEEEYANKAIERIKNHVW